MQQFLRTIFCATKIIVVSSEHDTAGQFLVQHCYLNLLCLLFENLWLEIVSYNIIFNLQQ